MGQPAIVKEFLELTRLSVGIRRERLMAEALTAKLKIMGFSVEEDETGAKIGGEAGNLIARLNGDPAKPALLFSAHMDRVDNHGHIQPRLSADSRSIVSDGTSILAADDVSGICAILDGARRIKAEGLAHGPIEVVLSVAEEAGLLGARHLDYSKIRARMAYVVDTSGPVGTLVNQAPTQYTIKITVRGKSAHAGMEPEKGINAIKVAAVALSRLREGRLSPHSTSNFGLFKAGQATNIVCQLAEIEGEARSTNSEELAGYLDEIDRVFQEAAREFGADITVERNLEYETYLVDESEEVIRLAGRAMKNLGLSMRVVASGGGSDGNYFNHNGLKAVGLSPGYLKVHTPEEEQPVDQLVKCGELMAEIIREAARC